NTSRYLSYLTKSGLIHMVNQTILLGITMMDARDVPTVVVI
ncbi:uncharacterized protein METZ01_LOCUS323429, partial [marine metagenome]